jgi:Fe-coproporphyrin III synthase
MRSPRSVDIEITARCNLRCTYCYYFENPAVPYRDLPTEEWLTFFEECGRLGVMELTLAGGEPFMRPDLKTLLEGIVRNRMRFSLLSNGTVIDDDWAAFIAGTGRCNFVQVSVDGSRPETHDACRGEGSFERSVGGIRTLQRQGVPVAVRMTIHRHNVDDLEATAHLLLDELGLPGFEPTLRVTWAPAAATPGTYCWRPGSALAPWPHCCAWRKSMMGASRPPRGRWPRLTCGSIWRRRGHRARRPSRTGAI